MGASFPCCPPSPNGGLGFLLFCLPQRVTCLRKDLSAVHGPVSLLQLIIVTGSCCREDLKRVNRNCSKSPIHDSDSGETSQRELLLQSHFPLLIAD
ncbi:hypothetical protein GYMLUDRAFT_640377 [Collybiopsis luxurians FD-317 M1]|nr:hypothetical protein GYMLUDRAFT_640377 [Collybiopsis luxurians FD-317 M1]